MSTVIYMDFESYYDREYSLRKMTPVEYILDPRFDCIGCAVIEGHGGAAVWYDAKEFAQYISTLKGRQARGEKFIVVSHNALFDMCILVWKYMLLPDAMIDTLGMARALIQYDNRSLSLAKVAEYLGLGQKGNTIGQVAGMSADDIKRAGLWDDYVAYATNDVALCRYIFLMLKEKFPPAEYEVMDMVIRAACVPRFVLDVDLLHEHLAEVRANKETLLSRVNVEKEDLMSNPKFAQALMNLGVVPPTKISMNTGLETYAFAKTDPGMIELEEHENPDVQALTAARLGFKSTQEETRTERLIAIANLEWPGKVKHRMPVPLKYSGAHTHRFSGDWKLNLQNFKRGGALRKALVAPPGFKVVVADAAQIEARLVAWLAGADKLTEAFAGGRDVYCEFASTIYDRTITKTDKLERFIGKTGVLGLGYGVGPDKFRAAVKAGSRIQLGEEVDVGIDGSQNIVDAYRKRMAPEVPKAWYKLDKLLVDMRDGNRVEFGPCIIEKEAILLPNGLRLHYPRMGRSSMGEWECTFAGNKKYIYGGKLYENICQALARCLITDAARRVKKRFPGKAWANFAHQVHDELIYVVPDAAAEEMKQVLLEEMTRGSKWSVGLPLASEADIAQAYGLAK
jgi:DNA polymerase